MFTKLSLTFQYKLGSLTPVVLDIARQHTYAQFRHVVHSSLQHSVGWEQIALYFYLTRTAVHVAKGSVSVAHMAYQYFRETYSGWVEERGGWVSVVCYTYRYCLYFSNFKSTIIKHRILFPYCKKNVTKL